MALFFEKTILGDVAKQDKQALFAVVNERLLADQVVAIALALRHVFQLRDEDVLLSDFGLSLHQHSYIHKRNRATPSEAHGLSKVVFDQLGDARVRRWF